jgi:hypothetical protein
MSIFDEDGDVKFNFKGLTPASEKRYAKRQHSKPGAVDFIIPEFNNLLEDQGTRIRVTPSILCPNRTSIDDTNHVLDCPICFGDEVVDLVDECTESWAGVTGIHLEKIFNAQGIYDLKDCRFTFQTQQRVYYWYKIEILDFASIYNQVIKKSGTDTDKIRYDFFRGCDTPVFLIDSKNKRYTVNEDFLFDKRTLRWLKPARPAAGTLFSISYPIAPTFRVIELMNENRYYYVGFKQKEKVPINLPQQALCRWDYIASRSGSGTPK